MDFFLGILSSLVALPLGEMVNREVITFMLKPMAIFRNEIEINIAEKGCTTLVTLMAARMKWI